MTSHPIYSLLLIHWDSRLAETLDQALGHDFALHHVPDLHGAAHVLPATTFDCILLPWSEEMLEHFPNVLGQDPALSQLPVVLVRDDVPTHEELPAFAAEVIDLGCHPSVLHQRLFRLIQSFRIRPSGTGPDGMAGLLSRLGSDSLPHVRGLTIDHSIRPSGSIRRDYFDLFYVREDVLRLVMMDLAGSDGQAAIMASLLHSIFRTTKTEYRSLRDTLALANNQLLDLLEPGDESASIFAMDLSLPDGEIEYVSAGHSTGLLIKSHKQMERLPPTGPVLGLVYHVYVGRKINIGSSFELTLCTNGLHQWETRPGRRFGQERLLELTEKLVEQESFSSQVLMDSVEAMADAGKRFNDDATVLKLSWTLPKPEGSLFLDQGMQKLLIVDDVPSTLKILVDAFRDNYELMVATNGEDALRLARENGPDLILLDIVLPKMNGYEVCHLLKNEDKTRDIPIIFMTAMDEEEDEIKGLQMGAVDYIRKPFSLPVVKSRVFNHMELKRKTDRLESLASLDGLTSIPNRRGFDERLNREWLSAVRSGKPLSMIMVDIDHFKRINDNYGHAAGDDVLRQIARILLDSLKRSTDFLARFGGEEFAVILPYTEENGAVLVAESIHKAVSETLFRHAGEVLDENITISLGVAGIVPSSYDSPRVLVELADARLYDAKTRGRNQVVHKQPGISN